MLKYYKYMQYAKTRCETQSIARSLICTKVRAADRDNSLRVLQNPGGPSGGWVLGVPGVQGVGPGAGAGATWAAHGTVQGAETQSNLAA